ncbi:AsmA family protein [Pseudoxanthobacter sp.]|uniref:AsmA family protein n=1 Tax=Pseudoxanthobacter sp. TaxID=1925742 RepID=UPI002FE13AB2
MRLPVLRTPPGGRRTAIAAAIFVALLLVLWGLPHVLPVERMRGEIGNRLSAALGHPVAIRGPISLSLVPRITLSAGDVSVGDLGAGDGTEALALEGVRVGVRLAPLFTGTVALSDVTLIRPKVRIVFGPDGRTNWAVAAPAAGGDSIGALVDNPTGAAAPDGHIPAAPGAEQTPLAAFAALPLGTVQVVDGEVSVRDDSRGIREDLTAIDLTLTAPAGDRLADAEGRFLWNGADTSLTAGLGAPGDRSRTGDVPFSLALTSGPLNIAADGTAYSAGRLLTGTAKVSGNSLGAVLARLGIAVPQAPAFGAFSVSAHADIRADDFDINEIAIDLTGLRAGGALRGVMGRERPAVGVRLAIENLALSAFRGPMPAGSPAAAGQAAPPQEEAAASQTPLSWPNRTPSGMKLPQPRPQRGGRIATGASAGAPAPSGPIPAPFGLLDANVALSAATIDAGPVPVRDLSATLSLTGGALEARITRATIGGANATGAIAVDGRGATPALTATVQARDIDAARLVELTGGSAPVTGRLGLDASFAARGWSGPALLSTLDGKGRATLSGGTVSGLGLASLFGDNPAADKLTNVDLTADFASLSAPVRVDGGLDWRGDRFSLQGTVAAKPLLAGETGAVDVTLASKRLTFGFTGKTAIDGQAGGNSRLSTGSLRDLMAWLERPLQPGGGLGAFSLDGHVNATPDQVAFDKATFSLDGTRGTASGTIRFGGRRPMLEAALGLSVLDLRPYLGAAGLPAAPAAGGSSAPVPAAGSAPAAGGTGRWSEGPIDFSGLTTLDARLAINADAILLQQVRIGKTGLTATIDGGTLTAKLAQMSLYEGTGAGNLTIEPGRSGATVSASFRMDNLAAAAFLGDAAGFSYLDGRLAMNFDVSTSGRSERDLVAGLNGNGAMRFSNGSIRNVDIPGMMRGLTGDILSGWQAGSSLATAYSQMTGTFSIDDGILTNNDLVMSGPLFRVTGSGTADLVARTIDYRLDPKVLASLAGGSGADMAGFNVPVIMEGPWSSPRIYPEVTGILRDPAAALRQLKVLGGSISALAKGQTPTAEPGATPGTQQPGQGAGGIGGLIGSDGKVNTGQAVSEALRILGGQAAPQPVPQPPATEPDTGAGTPPAAPATPGQSAAEQARQLLNQFLKQQQ